MRLLFAAASSLFCSLAIAQQVTYTVGEFSIQKLGTTSPTSVQLDLAPKLQNLELPTPGSARWYLNEIKKKSELLFPREAGAQSWKTSSDTLTQGKNFNVQNMIIIPTTGDTIYPQLAGGIPNDNTMAIANNGFLLAAFNSRLWGYDVNADTLLFPPITLHSFSSQFSLNDKYDPKLIYDPKQDKFVLVFLNGRLSTENNIIVCFSETNDPSGNWNLYEISGNPLNDTTWTDYPAIALSQDELFITGNLLRDNESWQTGFSQTIIWQINKHNGYNGDTSLTSTLWTDIKYNGLNVRNSHPVRGGSELAGPNQYLISNRNFAIQSDTIYLIEISNTQDQSPTLSVTLGRTDVTYGAPPNARQSHIDDLATNDARVLGAFIENDEIQYVANTIDTTTGFAGIYHGIITDVATNPDFTGVVLTDDSLDLGYPNIAYVGNINCPRQSVIAFDHTSPYHFAGHSAILHNSLGEYSEITMLKEGLSSVDRLSGLGYERWGDYSGIQRMYNTEGRAWAAGFYGKNNSNFTWVSELIATNNCGTNSIDIASNKPNNKVFPNPASNQISVQFEMPDTEKIWAQLYTIDGRLIQALFEDQAKKGTNEFSISLDPLSKGVYILRINTVTQELINHKIIKK